jgi:ATP-binding cassette, subfamily B, bacterial
MPLRRRRRGKQRRNAVPAVGDLPPLKEPRWFARAGEVAETGLRTMARHLPALIRQALKLAWRANRADTVITISLNLAAGFFTAFGLLATTGVLTALFSAGPTPDRVRAALPSLIVVGVAAGLRAALQAGAGWAQSRLVPQVERIVELQLYELTTAVELAALDDSDFLDDLQRAEGRGLVAAPLVVQNTVDVLTHVIGLVAAAGTLGVLHPVLLPLLLLTAFPEGWASIRAARMRYLMMLTLAGVRRRKWILADLMTDRRHAGEVRSFTMRGFLFGEYDRVAAHQRNTELDLARRQTVTRVIGDALKGVALAGIYTTLGLMLWLGAVPLAIAGTAVLAIRTGQSALANLVYTMNRCYEEGLYFGDYLGFCAEAARRIPDPGPRRGTPVPESFDTITVEDLTFAYPGADEPSLRGVSIKVRRGEIVALVGENGSGKSTLAKILAGLYEPVAGDVRWDGVSVRTLDAEQLRTRIAVIAQDYTRWPMTARQNITMGRPDENGADTVHAAARASGADEVVAELAQGYDTLLDRRFEGGAELSGGQWQRLAVGRGFFRDAPLLICDEPTAALDARAEHALFERIRRHADGRTVLLITHRLASVRYADRIYVLDHGKVIEQGDHAALMAAGGLYAELYGLQAAAYHG